MKTNVFLSYCLTALFIFTAHAALAQEGRIRDLSLSPAESMQPQNNAPVNSYQQPYQNQRTNGAYGNSRLPATPQLPANNNPMTPSSHFMDGYCDPNFKPLLARSPRYAAMAQCLEQQKQEACSQFQQLPQDARNVMDATIGCLYNADNADTEDGQPAYVNPANCAGNDTSRMQMLKKYWQDQNTSYALVFLPDEVMDTSGSCMRGR